mgnify:CR=1 FL=1
MATIQEEINARIEAERIRRMNMSNPQVNQPGFFSNIFGGPQTIPQTRPEVLNQNINQMNQPNVNQGPGFLNVPYMLGIDNRPGADYFTYPESVSQTEPNILKGFGGIYDLGTGGTGVYTGKENLPVKPSMLDKMSGLEMMNLIQGLQGLLAQPDADIRLDTSSPGASSGLRLPTQDLYSGLLK